MPLVFKLLSLDVTGLHGQRGVETFEGLDAGHLIGAGQCVYVAASSGVVSYTSHTVRICSAHSRGSSGGGVSH
jgi:hypothetical protein